MKTCSSCGETQPLDRFSKDRKRKDGVQPHCKSCFAEYRRANRDRLLDQKKRHYAENADRYKQRAAEWRADNPERKRHNDATWREKNIDRKRANDRAWYEANRAWKKAYDAGYRPVYYRSNKSLFASQRAKRRAAEKNAMPAWADVDAMREIYAEAKRKTQETGKQHEVDHIVPLQSDVVCGLHVPENLRVVTLRENRSKGNGWSSTADHYDTVCAA